MKSYALLRSPFVLAIVSTFSFDSTFIAVGSEAPDWDRAQLVVIERLLEPDVSISALALEARVSRPVSPQEAMSKMAILMRAGMDREAVDALDELKGLWPELDNQQVGAIYYHACDSIGAFDLAKTTLEAFAENVSDVELESRLISELRRRGWTTQAVDDWFAGMPNGAESFWLRERLRFNLQMGRVDSLVKELSTGVRNAPKDIGGAITFLKALAYARRYGDLGSDLSWVREFIEPGRAVDAETIASALRELSEWEAAADYYEQAATIPLTEEEVAKLGMNFAVMIPPGRMRAMFSVQAREKVAECLLQLERADEAQQWMVDAAGLREKHELGRNAFFSGVTQAASGARVMEGRIREEETLSADSVEYWKDRADYYRGRNEPDEEERALLNALALAPARSLGDNVSRRQRDWRGGLVSDYARFLARRDRLREAVGFLRGELTDHPADAASSEAAARLLAFDFEKSVSVRDEVLWTWLGHRPKWGHLEERLLWRMLERANRNDLGESFARAEMLALDGDPTRASRLGWIENRMGFPQRSIRLLEHAIETTRNNSVREDSYFTLFESHLDAGDWRNAEKVFPQARRRLTVDEIPEWFSRIAIVAAQAGASDEAMRLWRRVANLNPTRLDGLERLVAVGLREDLREFYAEMGETMPSSRAPALALSALN